MAFRKEAVQKFLCSQWTQKALLIVFITACFWDGLWGGVPRADQVIYLHWAHQYGSLYDILKDSISWNRVLPHTADVVLFRPLLFVQLGLFYYFFRYNFVAWQVASLVIHIFTVLTLHSILIHGALKKTVFPVLLSALFGCAFFSSELVYWSHISGYITYCLLFFLQVLFLVKFFKENTKLNLVLALTFGALAEFTYELGVIQNIIVFVVFAARYFSLPPGNVRILKIGALFFIVAIAYPVISYADLVSRGFVLANTAHQQTTDVFRLSVVYSFQEIGFWFRGLFFPHMYLIAAEDRASLQGKAPLDWIFWISLFAVVGLFWIYVLSVRVFSKKNILMNLNKIAVTFVFFVFLFLYALIIACGRAIPRGIDYVFNSNLYYAYISYAIVFSAIAIFYSFDTKYSFGVIDTRGRFAPVFFYIVFLLFFIEENFASTSQLGAKYRYQFSAKRIRLLNIVQKLVHNDIKNKNGYFLLDQSCSELPPLPWLPYHLGQKFKELKVLPTLADALFSEYSFVLNEKNINGKSVYIKKIECEKISVSSQLGGFGGGGLPFAAQPGWHAATPVVFPQEIDVKFIEDRPIKGIRLLFQDGLIKRGPRQIEILGGTEKGTLRSIFSTEVDCKNDSSVWRDIEFKKSVSVNSLKLVIKSNCGDPQLLTLRGLRIID